MPQASPCRSAHSSLVVRARRHRCDLRQHWAHPRLARSCLHLHPPRRPLFGISPGNVAGKPSRTWRRNTMSPTRNCLRMRVSGMSLSPRDPCRNGLLPAAAVQMVGARGRGHCHYPTPCPRNLYRCHRPIRVARLDRIERLCGLALRVLNEGKYRRATRVSIPIIT